MRRHTLDGATSTELKDLAPGKYARFVRRAAEFIDELEHAETSSRDRAARLKTANRELKPLLFLPSQEPRRTVVEALRTLDGESRKLTPAIREAMVRSDPPMSPEVACTLLELLVEAAIDGGEALAFEALDRFPLEAMDQVLRSRFEPSLVYLAGIYGGSDAMFDMLGRIEDRGGLTHRAWYAALRLVASREPGRLEFALHSLRKQIEQSPDVTVTSLRRLTEDLIRRSSKVVALTLVRLEPAANQRLFSAAFGPQGVPLGFSRRVSQGAEGLTESPLDTLRSFDIDQPEPSGDGRLRVCWAGGDLVLDQLRPQDAERWYHAVLNATGAPLAATELETPDQKVVSLEVWKKKLSGGVHG